MYSRDPYAYAAGFRQGAFVGAAFTLVVCFGLWVFFQ